MGPQSARMGVCHLTTVMYSLGVFVVILLEKAFEGRHEHGGFGPSLVSVFQHADSYHVWVNTMCLSGALLGYNVLSIVQRQLGEGGLTRLFILPLRYESGEKEPETLSKGAL